MHAMQGPQETSVQPLPIYFINRAPRTDRLAFMSGQFERLGLVATRIAGAEPAELSAAQLDRYCNPRAAHFLSPQQLCCTLGHVAAWQALVESGAERGLVLEDDAILSAKLPGFLATLPADLPCDLLRIENSARPHLTGPVLGLRVEGIDFRSFRSTGWGAAGYIVTRRAAELLLASPDLYDLPTDAALFCPLERPASQLRLLQTDPALCIQLKERPVQTAAAASGITSFLYPKSFTAWWSIRSRGVRWGWIKLIETLTRRDLKRRAIPFIDDLGHAN